MEQADQQQQEPRADGSTRDPEEEPALETEGAAAEQAFSLLRDLPGPLMRQLVQRHLDGAALLALQRTSHSLARAVVQHHTHQQRRALSWTWTACWGANSGVSGTDVVKAATAASLLERWAPAELHVTLQGSMFSQCWEAPPFPLPPAVLPLITHLRLHKVHLTPAAVASLQQCQRLHTLDVEDCWAVDTPEPSPPGTLQPLPLLRTLKYRCTGRPDLQPWALEALSTLCVLATEVWSDLWLHDWARRFTHVTHWVVAYAVGDNDLEALLRLPSLRHVRVPWVSLGTDFSQQACRWETVTIPSLCVTHDVLRLPLSIGRVVVAHTLLCGATFTHDDMAVFLWRCDFSRVQLQVDSPPSHNAVREWHLGGEEGQSGFFTLRVRDADAWAVHAPLLRRTLLAPGGGPHTLEVIVGQSGATASVVLALARSLQGTRVRTLCLPMGGASREWRGVLCTLPASVACVRLEVETVQEAAAVVFGQAVAQHPLRVVLVLSARAGAWQCPPDDEQTLRLHCAAHHPMMEVEVKRRG